MDFGTIGPIWFCKSKAKFVFTHLRFHKIGGEKQREWVWEYERDAVLEVLDTVDNSILSTQSTCYCCYWCCCYCYSSMTCSWCLLNVFVLFALNANVQIAFCIVDALLPRIWHHFTLAWENIFPDCRLVFFSYSGIRTSFCGAWDSLLHSKITNIFFLLFAIKQTNFIIDWKIKCCEHFFLLILLLRSFSSQFIHFILWAHRC